MKILVACEESQAVTIRLRALGHEAYSCDLIPCSGGHPEWHFQQDAIEVANGWFDTNEVTINENFAFKFDVWSGNEEYEYRDKEGSEMALIKQIGFNWDMLIAFPPCTHLAVSGAAWFEKKRKDGRQQQGIDFFMQMINAPIEKIAVENPIGIMSKIYRKPDQIIQPWMFGESVSKSTCLWLKNLPLLKPTNIVEKNKYYEWIDKKTGKKKRQDMWYYETAKLPHKTGERGKARSKTFQGIAEAMATQWTTEIFEYQLTLF